MARPKTKYKLETLQAIYQANLARYQNLVDSNNTVDTKNGILIGAILAVGVFIFQEPLFTKAIYSCYYADYRMICLLVVGTMILLASLAVSILAIWPRKWQFPSNTLDEQPTYVEMEPADVTLQLISDIESSMEENKKRADFKAVLFMVGLGLFIFATFLLIIVQQNV